MNHPPARLVSVGIILAHLDAMESLLLTFGYYNAGRYGRLANPDTPARLAAIRDERAKLLATLPTE